MDHSPILCYGTPLPPEALSVLIEHGVLKPSPTPSAVAATIPDIKPMTGIQAQIWAALTSGPLNERQVALLQIYWLAWAADEPALSVEEAARRLAQDVEVAPAKAVNYVKGALRSFGRRLVQTLEHPPLKYGKDSMGDGVADEIPLLALLSIATGPLGENCHRLTNDGAVAVAAALGLNSKGMAAGVLQTGDPALDDLNEVVTVAMTRGACALLLRVQGAMGLSFDATLKALAAQAGAG